MIVRRGHTVDLKPVISNVLGLFRCCGLRHSMGREGHPDFDLTVQRLKAELRDATRGDTC